MKIVLIASIIFVPSIMYYLKRTIPRINTIYSLLALISTVVFGSIASTSIYQIIIENAVFMTTIHGIFLNPFFLATGSYLGVFVLYRLIILTFEEK